MTGAADPTGRARFVGEHREARIAFWRAYAAGLLVCALPYAVTLSLEYGDAGHIVSGVAFFLLIWSLWGLVAPRGAAFVALLLFAIGLLNVIFGSLFLYREEGPVVMIPFAVLAIPCNVFAVAFMWSARPRARALVQSRRRLRRHRRDDRVRAGGGM